MFSKDRVKELVRGVRDEGNIIGLVGEMDGLVGGGDREEVNVGNGVTIPLKFVVLSTL